jgi:hypothetical protein
VPPAPLRVQRHRHAPLAAAFCLLSQCSRRQWWCVVAYIIGGKEADAQERSDGGRARIYATC